MHRYSIRAVNVILIIAVGLVVCGCVSIQPKYTGAVVLTPDKLTPYVNKEVGVEFGLPQGWKEVPLPPAADEAQRLQFAKEATEAVMQIYCQGAFVHRDALDVLPLRVVSGMDPKAVEIWKERSMGGGLFDPEFMAFSGKTMKGYDLVETNYYLAWKHQGGFNCKYGIVMYGPKKYAEELEKDFLGIVNSLK
jgi:hypothetical protein